MKVFYSAILLCVVLITEITAEDSERCLEKIQRSGVITVAICKDDMFPMFYVDTSGKLAGHDIALAELIAHELNVKLKFDRTAETFEDVVNLVADEKVDAAVSMLSMTPGRAIKVRFTDPYLCVHPVLVENFFAADLESHKNNVQYASELRGTVYVDIVKKMYPNVFVYEEKSWDDAMLHTAQNISQIMIRDEIGIYTAINKNKSLLLNIKLTPLSDQFDYISIAVSKRQEEFAEWLNVLLKTSGYPRTASDILQ